VHFAYSWIVSHLSAKNYRNWWKFDEVLIKTNLLSFFGTRCTGWRNKKRKWNDGGRLRLADRVVDLGADLRWRTYLKSTSCALFVTARLRFKCSLVEYKFNRILILCFQNSTFGVIIGRVTLLVISGSGRMRKLPNSAI